MEAFWKHVVSFFDALSQLAGRCAFHRYKGVWQCWTQSANESISGAAERWFLLGHAQWVRRSIDRLALIVTLGRDKEHCRKAFLYDYYRSARYQVRADILPIDIDVELTRLKIKL